MGSIIKLAGDKIDVPVDFHGAKVKAKLTGDYEIVCPSCGEKQSLTSKDVKNAGTSILGKPTGASAFEIVAHGLLFAHQWNKAMAMAQNGDGDYIDFRLQVARALLDKSAWSYEASTSASTSLKLRCGHHVNVTFGKDIAIAKEPDRVQTFLKLGVKGERTIRYLRYIYGGDDAPAKLGEQKAAELTKFISETEAEKTKIKKVSEKLLAEIKREEPFFYGNFDRITSLIEVAKNEDIKLLTEAQLEKLNFVDKVLLRIVNRPLVK